MTLVHSLPHDCPQVLNLISSSIREEGGGEGENRVSGGLGSPVGAALAS